MTSHASPPGETTLHWEDFRAGEVREFGRAEVRLADVVRFAAEFDPQPFHLDEAAARHSLFGGLIASGWHTASMTMRMMVDGYLHRSASLGSPGVEHMKWVRPVRPGDTLGVRMTVLRTRPLASRPGVGLVTARYEVLNQRAETVMEMEATGLFRMRGAARAAG